MLSEHLQTPGLIMIICQSAAGGRCLQFYRPLVQLCCTCGLVTGVEKVVSAKLLGVTFSHNLNFDDHVKNILTICNQRSYLLKCLKGHAKPSL